jgi:hypothetical protein
MKATARAAAALGVDTVVGFTGSSIWKTVAMFPPVPQSMVDAGYRDFADRWNPILDVFDEVGVRFAHEVHPSRSPTTTGRRSRRWRRWSTAGVRAELGPQPLRVAGPRPGRLPVDFRTGSTTWTARTRSARSATGATAGWARTWPGPTRARLGLRVHRHGDVPVGGLLPDAHHIGYSGPISVEWEDAGMDRLVGAPEALQFVRGLAFDPPSASFDAAFSSGG